MREIITLSDTDQLDALVERSHERPVWIFKHSLLCGISSNAWSHYVAFADAVEGDRMDCTVVEIQNARPVSAAVAERTGVPHASPQAILLSSGRVAWHASHGAITAQSLADAMARLSQASSRAPGR